MGEGLRGRHPRRQPLKYDIADQLDAVVVTDDRYKDYADQHPWIPERRLPYMIVKGEVVLYDEQQP
ncbi:MAG: hypothetical protein LC795_00555 [Acidobacteria bacterium]|nr:hypothetical protein [Acidobacteriota bacterium]